ncbi:hypothetical protein [Billgrantia desiderata]|uniref:Uncharacterized protein n=1 Tax=Billgrantia desiderata TaxID=52021 RepID=A0ABS9B251_9GAMM|nr:hypothetical protein [Halomonas desiderata]MCE8012099.1 hypothetical protein [Halomonas desiderata]MCE8041510.1 hypothetical protein [Halomonas desiderata]MCE8046085.1 hypothetical protein [Halomonas desiderata]
MSQRHNAILTAAVIAISTFGAGSLLAQEEARQEPMKGQGMHGDMMQEGGMHGMMGQMQGMMENCNAMMERMLQEDASDSHT